MTDDEPGSVGVVRPMVDIEPDHPQQCRACTHPDRPRSTGLVWSTVMSEET